MPRNKTFNRTIEALEEKLIELKIPERTRTIDIKSIYTSHADYSQDGAHDEFQAGLCKKK